MDYVIAAAEVVAPPAEQHVSLACHIAVWAAVDIDSIARLPDTYLAREETPDTLLDKIDSVHLAADIVGIVEGEVDLQ